MKIDERKLNRSKILVDKIEVLLDIKTDINI